MRNYVPFNEYYLPIIACFLLFFSMIFYWISLTFSKQFSFFKIGQKLIILSNFLLGTTLLLRWFNEGYFPLSNLYESIIFLSWAFSSIHLIFEFQTKTRLIGGFSAPILFFLCGFSSLTLPIEMQKASPLVPSLQSNWLMMHVSTMMVSYAILILGSLFSILYLLFFWFPESKSNSNNNIQSSENKTILASVIPVNNLKYSKINLLETIDIWSYRIISLGFPMLTIGIISGAIWANQAWGAYWSWDPKETWALITWIVFAIYLHSRLIKGWQGKNAAILGGIGFFSIWICYLGVNFLAKGLHSYGWVIS